MREEAGPKEEVAFFGAMLRDAGPDQQRFAASGHVVDAAIPRGTAAIGWLHQLVPNPVAYPSPLQVLDAFNGNQGE